MYVGFHGGFAVNRAKQDLMGNEMYAGDEGGCEEAMVRVVRLVGFRPIAPFNPLLPKKI